MDVDVFLWQHVSRPCVLGEGKRRGRQRENTLFLFFFSPFFLWFGVFCCSVFCCCHKMCRAVFAVTMNICRDAEVALGYLRRLQRVTSIISSSVCAALAEVGRQQPPCSRTRSPLCKRGEVCV